MRRRLVAAGSTDRRNTLYLEGENGVLTLGTCSLSAWHLHFAVQPCADRPWTPHTGRATLVSFARGRMSKSRLAPPSIVPIDCPRCGSKGYVSRQPPSTNKESEVRIYLCGECGERTEITVLD